MRIAYLGLLAPLAFSGSMAAPARVRDSYEAEDALSTRAAPKFPFNKIVAFGDDFTDDGSGSYAHGITGNQKTGAGKHMWGANTFTDGLVAVSYLSKKIGIPISYNYAWGSAGGAQVIGSIANNKPIKADKEQGHAHYMGAIVPSALDQVKNYTTSGVFTNDIANTLHFFWTGNNDMIASLGWVGRFTLCAIDKLCIPGQDRFITNLVQSFEDSLTLLINAGAQHIMVPNVYPRDQSPWTGMWITSAVGLLLNFGSVIDRFNSQLSGLVDDLNAKHGTNIMLYDVNSYVKQSLANPAMVSGAGYTYTCVDGCKKTTPTGISNWNMYWNHTVVHHQPDLFYWMTEIMPSTTVHAKIAHDMKTFLSTQTW